jgi:peptidoglycan-associated lipoprotein
MNFLRALFFCLLVAAVTFSSGCMSYDDPEDGEAVPGATENPMAIDDLSVDPAGIDNWTQPGQDIPFADPDGWIPDRSVILPTIYFAYDQDRIGTSERVKLEKVADFMTNQSPDSCLIIEGHCDERGSEEYNRALGERRAIAIKDYLQNLGVSPDRMKTVSYGEEKPSVDGATVAAYAKNRRGELIAARPGK